MCYILSWEGINVEQQVIEPNAEFNPGLSLRSGVYFLKGLEYTQPTIETGIYLNAAFIQGNTVW